MAWPAEAGSLGVVEGRPRVRRRRRTRSAVRFAAAAIGEPLSYEQTRTADVTTITVTSPLVGIVYFFWFMDGIYAARTTSPSRAFRLAVGDQARIEVLCSNDPDLDVVANAPAGFPARRRLWWIRSLDASIADYRVDQKLGAGDWETLQIIHHQADLWDYEYITPRLDDLGSYTWQIVPVDTAGNDGTPLTIGPETIVRVPDAPRFEIAFDDGTGRVAFSEAA